MRLARTGVHLLGAAVAVAVILAVVGAYGEGISLFIKDIWGTDFSYYDNGLPVTAKLHRLPGPGDPGQAGPEAGWPERALRPACHFTLNLLGLSGPEGGLWTASMQGNFLVVAATDGSGEVGRYRVTQGSETSGLAVVECSAGPNGLYLMDLLQPRPETGWFVVRVYDALAGDGD